MVPVTCGRRGDSRARAWDDSCSAFEAALSLCCDATAGLRGVAREAYARDMHFKSRDRTPDLPWWIKTCYGNIKVRMTHQNVIVAALDAVGVICTSTSCHSLLLLLLSVRAMNLSSGTTFSGKKSSSSLQCVKASFSP